MATRIGLGQRFGVEMALHYSTLLYSTLLAGLLLVLSLGWRLQYMYPDWNTVVLWTTSILVTLMYGVGLILRGLAQLAATRWSGSTPHTFQPLTIGAAWILTDQRDNGGLLRAWTTAVAGIGANLLLGLLCLALASAEGSSPARIPATPLVAFLVWSGYVNLFLAALNVLPGLPLDGGRIVRACIHWGTGRPDQALRFASGGGQIIGGLMMLLGGFRLLTNAPFDGAWLLVLGWFIFETAQDSWSKARSINRPHAA